MRFIYPVIIILSLCLAVSPVFGADLVVSSPGSLSIGVGETIPLSLGVTGAVNGISGFHILLEVSGSGTIEITEVSFPEWVMLSEFAPPETEPGYIRGVDLTQQAGSGEEEIHLATFLVSGRGVGTVAYTVSTHILEDDFGGLYTVSPVMVPISVGVVSQESYGGSDNGQSSYSTPSPTVTSTPLPTVIPTTTPTTVPTPPSVVTQTVTEEPAVQTPVPSTGEDGLNDEIDYAPIETPVQRSPSGIFIPLAALVIILLSVVIRWDDETGETP